MLGEAYAIVHNSGIREICIFIMVIMAVLLLSFKRKIKGTAFLFSKIKDLGILKKGIICILFACIGYLNMHTIETKEKLADEIFSNHQDRVICVVSGKISDIQQGESSFRVYLTCNKFNSGDGSVEYKGKVKSCVYLEDITGLKLGQALIIEGQAGMPEQPANPGQFDAREYYKNKGIYFLIYDGNIIQKSKSYNYCTNMLYKLRSKAARIIDKIFSEYDAGLIKAMILGDRADMDKNTKRLYQRNGIAHILAISGLHIALLGMGLFRKLKKHIGSYILSGIFAVLIILLYGIITGLAVSTARAIMMLVIDIAGKAVGRSADMLTSLGLSCIVICITNPYVINDVGFLLSFGAIYAIAAIFPVLKSIIGKRADNRFFSALLVSLSVNIITTPIIVYFYYEFPLYGILMNIIVVPLVSVVLFFSVLSIFTGFLIVPFAKCLTIPVRFILAFYDVLCRGFEKLPYANINTGHISLWLVVFYYVVVGIILGGMLFIKNCKTKRESKGYENDGVDDREQGKKRHIKILLIVLIQICSCAAFIICISIYFKDCFRIVFLDVGQGDGILISTEMGTKILIDGGSSSVDDIGEYRLMPAIKYYGMSRLDYVFVTHGDEDHISGIKYLIRTEHTGITIENLVVAEYGDRDAVNELIDLAEKNNINVIYVEAGDMFVEEKDAYEVESGARRAGREKTNEGDIRIICLYPSRNSPEMDANNLSLVLKLETKNLSAVFTGDIGREAEKEILNMNVDFKCDILKVAHHGSKYSSCDGFLAACSPEYAVISCGSGNLYGHPHKETLERLDKVAAEIFRTDKNGAVLYEDKKMYQFICQ